MATSGSIQKIYDDLAVLRTGWVTNGWSWDGRLSCACSSFGGDLASRARALIVTVFAHTIDERSLQRAHPLIRELTAQTGGIRPEQLVFATDPIDDTLAYGLWWPWGDDLTISLRVGLVGLWAESEMANMQKAFRIAP